MNKETLRPIWGYKWWLLLFVIAAALGAYAISSQQSNTYQSTGSVQLQSGLQASGQFIDQSTLTQLANTYQNLAGTDAVAHRAAQLFASSVPTRPGSPTTTTTRPSLSPSTTVVPTQATALQQRLKSDVSISQQSEVTVLDFVATTGNARIAQRYAQAYASAFVQYVTDYQNQQRQDALNRIASQVTQIESQLTQIPVSLNPAAPEDPRRTALTSELQALQTQAATQQIQPRDSATLVQPANLPTSPASPNPKRDAALSGLAALIIGVLLVYLRVAFTEHYGSSEEAGTDLGLPVLAELPRLANRPELRVEAFRALRTSLNVVLRDRPNMVVLVTSSEASAGKTFVTLNLATSLALEDRHVVAVDADLRRPMLHTLTDIALAPGLANVLQGHARDLPVSTVSVAAGASLDVSPAGYAGREMAELLSRDKLERVIERLRVRYQAVVFDSPPVGAVVDAAIIAGRGTDGVIFVVNARSTRLREARRAVQTLRALEVPLLGLVFNESAARRDRYAERYAGSGRRGRAK